MSYTPNPDGQGWVTVRNRLYEIIAKWQKRAQAYGVVINCPAAPRYTTAFADPADRSVSVTFSAGPHVDRTITVDRFATPVDNLWAIMKGLDAIRLNEMRGIDDVARQMYQALPAPKTVRDPYEVLGLRPDASPEDIDAMYRSRAKRIWGDEDRMRELNAAYEALKKTALTT